MHIIKYICINLKKTKIEVCISRIYVCICIYLYTHIYVLHVYMYTTYVPGTYGGCLSL